MMIFQMIIQMIFNDRIPDCVPDDGHGDINGANNDKIRSDKECPNQSTHIHGGIFGLVS